MPRTKEAFDKMRCQSRIKIENAALSLFARKGLSVTVSEIARAANLSQGLLYSHYPSKEALIMGLVQQAAEISRQSMINIAQSDTTASVKIKRTTQMICEMLSSSNIGIEYFMFMVQIGVSGFQISREALEVLELRSPLESLVNIVAQGQAEGSIVSGDPLQLASVYWSAVQGMCCYAITGMPISPKPKMLSRILLKESFL